MHPLVERAAALVPMLKEAAPAAEQARRVSDATFDALAKAGVFRMTAPARYGGDEADFQTQCDVLAEIARGCASTSWVATIFSAMSWMAGVYPDQAQEEIFGDRDPRISGVFSPTGKGTPVDGGYRVSGRWGFNTGGHGGRWTVINVMVPQANGAEMPMCMIARATDLRRLDDWHATGMAATGSDTIVADDIFVPAYRAQPLPLLTEAKYAARHNAASPYFSHPLATVLTVNAGGTPLGIARGAIEAFRARLPGRGITYTYYTNQSEAAVTHLQLGEAMLTYASCDAHVRRATALVDAEPGRPLTVEQRVQARAHIAYATGLARDVVDTLFSASGASAIQTHVPIQRFQRDIQALANHSIMHPQTAMELYGRILCGLEPNTPLY
jgi:alkylation response protein AidB-like acyl-CoA dehydrogenase